MRSKRQCDPLSSWYACMRWWHTLSSYSKLMGQMESNFAVIFPRWLPKQNLNIGPYVKMNYSFFSETTNLIEPKLYMKNYWMAHYKILIFIWIWNKIWQAPQGNIKQKTIHFVYEKCFMKITLQTLWTIYKETLWEFYLYDPLQNSH